MRPERKFFDRVTTDLENLEKSGNLKETSESQGICLKSGKFWNLKHSSWSGTCHKNWIQKKKRQFNLEKVEKSQ